MCAEGDRYSFLNRFLLLCRSDPIIDDLKNAFPYRWALTAPTPDTFMNSFMVRGCLAAISASDALEKTT